MSFKLHSPAAERLENSRQVFAEVFLLFFPMFICFNKIGAIEMLLLYDSLFGLQYYWVIHLLICWLILFIQNKNVCSLLSFVFVSPCISLCISLCICTSCLPPPHSAATDRTCWSIEATCATRQQTKDIEYIILEYCNYRFRFYCFNRENFSL